MKNLIGKSLLVATCLIISNPAHAVPVVDGFLGLHEYSNSFTAGWYNGHNESGSQFKKTDNQTTTVRWASISTNFFLYVEVPIYAKSMTWGAGVADADSLSSYQHWCSPPPGQTAALDGSNCTHHKDGFDKFKTDFEKMTGSEKVILSPLNVKDGDQISNFKKGKKKSKGTSIALVGDLAKGASGTFYGTILDYKDSVDYVTSSASGLGCDRVNCGASNIPMAFEFKFGALNKDQIDGLIHDIKTAKLEFHLSPELGASSTAPEPSSIAILGLGLAALGFSRGKRKIRN